MDQTFVERLNDLTLLSQNHVTADHFATEYLKLLGELQEQLSSLKTLAVIQMGWLEKEKVIAKKDDEKEQ